jgi:hypothetical protein
LRVTRSIPQRVRSFTGVVVGVLILFAFFAGWIIAVGAAIELHRMDGARHWPSREAVLTHSYPRRVRWGTRGYHWEAEIAGRYLDDERTFSVSRVSYGIFNERFGRAGAEAVTARYPAGARVDVYRSPADPGVVILEPHVSATSTWIALGAGLAFGLLPIALYL